MKKITLMNEKLLKLLCPHKTANCRSEGMKCPKYDECRELVKQIRELFK